MSDTEKPASALEALENAASPDPEPSDSSSDDSQSQPETTHEAATDASSDGTVAEPDVAAEGEPPQERWKDILANARTKARDEASTEAQTQFDSQYGWAKTFDRNASERATSRVQQLDQDPIAFYRALQREIEAHPHLGPQLREPAKAELPQPSLQSADGRSAYTADEVNAFVEARVAQAQSELASQFQGVQANLDRLTQADTGRVQQQENQQLVTRITGQLRALPHATEHEPEIMKAIAAIPRDQFHANPELASYQAYLSVLQSVIEPKLGKQQKAKLRSEIQKKAGAATVDPSAATPTGTSKLKNRKDIAAFLKAKAGAA